MWLILTTLVLPLAQEAAPPGGPPAKTPQPRTVTVGETELPEQAPPIVVAGGAYEIVPVDSFDDSIPLPNDAVVQPGEAGDVLVSGASGDPYFLGFAAGPYHPSGDEVIDPTLFSQVPSGWNDGRPEKETYAFVMFSKRITEARLAELELAGARPLAFHPHYSMKVALPLEAVERIADLDFVRWVGAPRTWQRVHPSLAEAFASTPVGQPTNVYINLYESDLNDESTWTPVGTVEYGGPDGIFSVQDPQYLPKAWMSNGWQQRALQAAGADVYEYVDEIQAFRARLHGAAIENLLALDFVQFVEPEVPSTLGHDESMPMILADRSRVFYDGGVDVAVAGQCDSGIDYSHSGITGYYWWGTNLSGTSESTTADPCRHGTHVAGTIHGSGAVEDSYEGVANRLGNVATERFFNTKYFWGTSCSSGNASLATILASTASSVSDGTNVTPRPHAINHSWGAPSSSGGSFGSEAEARTIDSYVNVYDQLQVIIAHNWGPGAGTVSVHGSAKNAFTIGGVRDYYLSGQDPGEMYSNSGRGPTADSRWKPNVVAPATQIRSAWATTGTGYTDYTGTSMAAPHVTGLASQLVDHYSFLRHNPTTLSALLMATAMTKNDFLIQTEADSHLDNYGAGRVEAWKAHGYTNGTALYFWGWTQGTSAYSYVDVPVSTGATRIVVVMNYHEVQASSGASKALVNDLDLWIDAPPLTAGGNTGEYFAQQSTRDNTELRMINNPTAGTWRLKVYPQSATSSSAVGVCAYVIYGDTTPSGALTVSTADAFVKPNDTVYVTATASNPSYIASAVYFDSSYSGGNTLINATSTLKDGASASYLTNQQNGRDVLVGDIAPGDSRSVTWSSRWTTEGLKTWSVDARSDNWVDRNAAVNIYVDGTPPALPTNLGSSTHTANAWSNDPTITYTWTNSTDNLSGLDGYGIFLSTAPGLPSAVKDIEQVTSYNAVLSTGNNYLNLRPVDNSGNWNAGYASTGVYKYDGGAPAGPANLTSPSHPVGVLVCATNVSVTWNTATDAVSGLAGYVGVWDTSPSTNPVGTPNITAAQTGLSNDIGSSGAARYFHLRAKDLAGNYGTTQHYGPIYANAASVSTYCTGKLNSAGCTPAISSSNQPSMAAGNFAVTASRVVNKKNGLLFFGPTPGAVPFQGGLKCVLAPTKRTPLQNSGGSTTGNDCTGSFAFTFTQAFMLSKGIAIGDTVHCQWWYRDPSVAVGTTGLSNALRFTVCK